MGYCGGFGLLNVMDLAFSTGLLYKWAGIGSGFGYFLWNLG